MKINPREKRRHAACCLFSRAVIFTCARVLVSLLSLRKKWGTTRSLIGTDHDDESQGVMIDYNLNFSYVRDHST